MTQCINLDQNQLKFKSKHKKKKQCVQTWLDEAYPCAPPTKQTSLLQLIRQELATAIPVTTPCHYSLLFGGDRLVGQRAQDRADYRCQPE
jgi:hypothetical protein